MSETGYTVHDGIDGPQVAFGNYDDLAWGLPCGQPSPHLCDGQGGDCHREAGHGMPHRAAIPGAYLEWDDDGTVRVSANRPFRMTLRESERHAL